MRLIFMLITTGALLLLAGCGSSRENARVAVQQGQGIEAAHQAVIAQGELLRERSAAGEPISPEEQDGFLQAIAQRLRFARDQSEQLLQHLAIGLTESDLVVDTTVDEAREDFVGYRSKAQVQIGKARDETEEARALNGALAWLGRLVDNLTQNWFGWSLGLGTGGATGVALWALTKWRRWKGAALEIAKTGRQLLAVGDDKDSADKIKAQAEARQAKAKTLPYVETALVEAKAG